MYRLVGKKTDSPWEKNRSNIFVLILIIHMIVLSFFSLPEETIGFIFVSIISFPISGIVFFIPVSLILDLFKTNAQKYKEYMSSPSWERLKDKKLVFGADCECCGADATVIHHLSYDRLWDEDDKDLACLCKSCHYRCHFEDGEKIPLDEQSLRERFEEVKDFFYSLNLLTTDGDYSCLYGFVLGLFGK